MKLKRKVKKKLIRFLKIFLLLLVVVFVVFFVLKIVNNPNDSSEENFSDGELVNLDESLEEDYIQEPGWCGDGLCELEFNYDFDCLEDCGEI